MSIEQSVSFSGAFAPLDFAKHICNKTNIQLQLCSFLKHVMCLLEQVVSTVSGSQTTYQFQHQVGKEVDV